MARSQRFDMTHEPHNFAQENDPDAAREIYFMGLAATRGDVPPNYVPGAMRVLT